MKLTIIEFCTQAIEALKCTENFASDFVKLKVKFFNQHQGGMIFSTRFGADFFEEMMYRVTHNMPILPDPKKPKEKIGEYDENFNKWLKNLKN